MTAQTLTERDHERLERFVDDALPADEASAVEQQIEAEPAWAEAHADLLALRAILQDDVEAAVEQADFSNFFAGIEARLPAASAASAVEAAPSPARPARVKRGSAERYRDRLVAWWRRNWTPVLLGAAVAAAIAIWVTATRAPQATPAMVPVAETAGDTAPVVVEGIKNGGDKTVLVNQPVDDDGATVIWLLDEEQVDDEKTEPAEGEDPI